MNPTPHLWPERLKLTQEDGSARPIDEIFEPSELLYRGFGIENKTELFPGSCFSFDPKSQPGCSVNRSKYSIPEDMRLFRAHSGCLSVSVDKVPSTFGHLPSDNPNSELVVYQTQIIHSPDNSASRNGEPLDNYAHTEIRIFQGGRRIYPPKSAREAFRIEINDAYAAGDVSVVYDCQSKAAG
jgi:hypothetical protein